MKTIGLKNLAAALVTGAALFNTAHAAPAKAGFQAASLKFDCKGKLEITGFKDIGVTPGFTNRAGHQVPPHGHASLKLKPGQVNTDCLAMQKKLQISITTSSFETYFSTPTTDLTKITAEVQAKVGELVDFTAEQNFWYQDEQGNLPLFPYAHGETVFVKADSASQHVYLNQSINVNADAVYKIPQNEEAKVIATNLMFYYIKLNGMKALPSMALLTPLVQNHPEWTANFSLYLVKLLALFSEVEVAHQEKDTFDFALSTLAAEINGLTHQLPEVYAFDLAELLANHPSLLKTSDWSHPEKAFPNITAQVLESAVLNLEAKLALGQVPPTIKASYKKVLQIMAGSTLPGGKLDALSSTLVKAKSASILAQYY
jgi:hypothetical protein